MNKLPNSVLWTKPMSVERLRALDILSKYPKRAFYDALVHTVAVASGEYDKALDDGRFIDLMEDELRKWK